MRLLISASLLLAALLVPASASASTVAISDGVMVFEGAPGEANVVDTEHGGNDLFIQDTGAKLTAGNGCTTLLDGRTRCAGAGGPGFARLIDTGDGDDTIVVRGDGFTVMAGAGNDHVDGSSGDDTIDGGTGVDTLEGGAGDDVMSDGDNDAGDADRLTGGDGLDTLSVGARRAGLKIDLAALTTADGDRIAGFENLRGGPGPDTLIGDGDDNTITGGAGKDRLEGRAGADELEGGTGRDRFICGQDPDTDVVLRPERAETIDADCDDLETTAKAKPDVRISFLWQVRGRDLIATAKTTSAVKLSFTLLDAKGNRVGRSKATRVSGTKRIKVRLRGRALRFARDGRAVRWTARAQTGKVRYAPVPVRVA